MKSLLSIVLALACASSIWAAPVYLSATRLVSASAGPNGSPGVDDTDSPPFGSIDPWMGDASAEYTSAIGGSSASASQVSSFEDDGIFMDGALAVSSTRAGLVGIAQSTLSLSFQLTEATPYVSEGVGPVTLFSLTNSGAAFSMNSSGTLPPAIYSLSIRYLISGGAAAPTDQFATYDYSLRLGNIVPEPAGVSGLLAGFLLMAGSRGRRG